MLKYSRITVWNNHFGCILREDKMKELLSNLDQIESDKNLKKNKPESFQPSKASQTFQCFEK